MNKQDILYLLKRGYSGEDIPQMEEFEKHMKFTLSDGKKITRKQARHILGSETYVSGLNRATFHWTCVRESQDGVKVYFDCSKYWNKILAEDDKKGEENAKV